MNFSEIAESVGIKKISPSFKQFSETASPISICDKRVIEDLEAKYSFLGELFPRDCTEYDKLPEDASLQRKIKELYLGGEYIFSFNGILKK